MSTDPVEPPRRLAVVLARYAAAGAPPGIDPRSFAAAALADTYEVVADLVGVRARHRRTDPASCPCCGPAAWP